MTLEEYSRQFGMASDRRLVETIDRPTENDPLAVEAARAELLRRKLSEEEIAGLRVELAEEGKRGQRVQKKVAAAKRTIASASGNAQEILIDSGRMAPERRLTLWLITALGFCWLYTLPQLRWLPMLFYYPSNLGLDELEAFLPIIWLPAAMTLLWKRRRSGWFLGALFAAYLFGLAFGSLAANVKWTWEQHRAAADASSFTDLGNDIGVLDPSLANPDTLPSGAAPIIITRLDGSDLFEDYYNVPDWDQLVLGFLFALGLLLLFLRQKVTGLYLIGTREKWISALPIIALMCLRAWAKS